jgi:transposase-like protein
MANILPLEKQVMAIHALAEGSSIRSIERMTNIHRDTIMRLGVKVGQACATLLDEKMRNLELGQIEVDEIWGFIGKKAKNVTRQDNRLLVGDVWTYIAIDVKSKLIPSYFIGKRDAYHTNAFMMDLAARIKNRVQISSDKASNFPGMFRTHNLKNINEWPRPFVMDASVPFWKPLTV